MNRNNNNSSTTTDSTKPSSSALQPFPLLITKRSQQHVDDTPRGNTSSRTTTHGGISTNTNTPTISSSYLILIQHSMSLYHRIQLHDRHITTTTNTTKDYSCETYTYPYFPKEKTPEDTVQGSTCGLLFMKDSFHRISETSNGSFILLCLAGTGHYLWNYNNNDNDNNDEETNRRRRRTAQLFNKHGVIVDASTDPLGWDTTANDQSSSTVSTPYNNNYSTPKCNCIIPSRIDNLNQLVQSIQEAIQPILVQRNKTMMEDGESLHHIPIIIDSITPLLIYHGVATTINFLQTLRHWHWSNNTIIDSTVPPTTTTTTVSSTTLLSPIITPILKESLLPQHHKIMEDSVADAIVSLDGDRATIIRKSVTSGKVTKEEQFFSVGTTTTTTSTTNTSSSSSLHHTLIFHPPHDIEGPNTNERQQQQQQQQQQGGLDNTKYPLYTKDHHKSNPWKQNEEMFDTGNKGKSLLLHHEDEDTNVQQKQSQMPRIFMQHDDIEFHDFDEDEPDDDLDL
jgi:hypothetical protein